MASLEKPFEFVQMNGSSLYASLEDACELLVNGFQYKMMNDHRDKVGWFEHYDSQKIK
jgi:hypothetical protein